MILYPFKNNNFEYGWQMLYQKESFVKESICFITDEIKGEEEEVEIMKKEIESCMTFVHFYTTFILN